MGLLTDPKQRQRLIALVSKYNQKLCILLYFVGLTWFLALAYEPLNGATYFSENALLPGLVENELYADTNIELYNTQLLKELKKNDKEVPKEWILKQFQNLGLEVYTQNFTLKYPFGPVDRKFPGKNIYAILRAGRSASTESVVISAPLRPLYAESKHTNGGIAIMMALAKHFKSKPYIAKDIIFLMPEFDEVGMQAWLDAFHRTKSEYIMHGRLPGRSGQIQAAFNLEIPSDKMTYLNLKLEGINGQQPNLDFVNLVVRLCRKEMVSVALNKMEDYRYPSDTFEGYTHALKTMLNMMWHQSPGSPTGNHGLFHRYHIEALTISGESAPGGKTVRLSQTARIVEGVFRSLNNLLERFHQSFFFYILAGTQRYISIGIYMPPFALMVAAGLIKAVALWISEDNEKPKKEEKKDDAVSKKEESKTEKGKDAKASGVRKRKNIDVLKETKLLDKDDDDEDDVDDDDDDDETVRQPVGLRSLVPVVSICLLLGFLGYIGPNMLASFSSPFRLRVQDALTFGLLALFSASLFYPRMIRRKSADTERFMVDWQTLKSVALILLSLVMFSVALMNISLAFFLTATMMPVCTLVTPTKSRLLTWLQKFLLLLVSPASFMFCGAIIQALVTGSSYTDYSQFLFQTITNVKDSVLLRLLDQCFFESWTYTIMTLVVFPSWLMFWGIPHCHVD